ncbi:MAG TPA: twin-arginine translocation signal domain-containing protein [Pyrinomonadaceae bacterium]|nr:twin-arginine translocation signal domain-containing protein [Pyrinomonadaceae bacterium]
MDRRRFLKFSAGGAATAAVGATLAYVKPFSHSPEKEAQRVEVPTTCDMRVNNCSLIAVVENGVIDNLNPNP